MTDTADTAAPAEVPTARAVLEHLVGALVEDRDAVRIDLSEGRSLPRLTVRVGRSDMGRVIGKRGRVAQAIRTVVRAAAARDGSDVEVEFED
ncbi:MAG TPA: KH domain-containing protein [Acidimicrobiales bacterium]